jgi:hypothetical protein
MAGVFERKILPVVVIYFTALILIYLAIIIFNIIKTPIIVAIISSFFIIIVLLVIYFLQKLSEPAIRVKGKEAVRYTMFCHNCGWEWMSHTTDRSSPQKCPNCTEKTHLEIIGLRKVRVSRKKREKPLKNFIPFN